MTFVSLSIPLWPIDAARSTDLASGALKLAPRILAEPGRGLLWADARGLDGVEIAARLLALSRELEIGDASAGLAQTPIAAEVAARQARETRPPMVVVAERGDREFLSPLAVGVLQTNVEAWIHPLLAAVGIQTCGDLAKLDRESVEVRFGGA